MGNIKSSPSYEEALMRVRNKGIKTPGEYELYYKELGLPKNPNRTYRGKGWIRWAYFLGTSPTFEEAKRIVKKNGIKSKRDYEYSHKDLSLPSDPRTFYKEEGWTNWVDFLGNAKAPDYTYEEAKRIVEENGIMTKRDYKSSFKDLGLPSAPDRTFKDNGWTNWFDFLSKPIKVSRVERKTRILTKLLINPALLEDDAPLQIIYMLASQLDKQLAKEFEEPLGTTSIEKRLKWIKNQLNGIKEGTSPKHCTKPTNELPVEECFGDDSFEDYVNTLLEGTAPTDELSVMESIIEEFTDYSDTLSEKDRLDLNIRIENYMHNAVNRHLISEYDG